MKKKDIIHKVLPYIYFPLILIYLEFMFRVFVLQTTFNIYFLIVIFVSICLGALLYLLCSLFTPKINRILVYVCTGITVLVFIVQTVYLTVFQTPLVLYSLTGAGQVLQFMDIILGAIGRTLPVLFLMVLVPFGALVTFQFLHINFPGFTKRNLFILPAQFILPLVIIFASLSISGTSTGSFYQIYYHESPGTLVLNRFGLLVCIKNDIRELLLPAAATVDSLAFSPVQDPLEEAGSNESSEETKTEAETEVVVVREPNVMDIDFDALAQTESNDTLALMHQYFNSIQPTYTNEYTGMFEGYNLILLTAESFSSYVIDEELTPTLYKLANEGFIFNNFYNPIWGVSTSDGEYVACTGLIPKSGVWSMAKSGSNLMYFTMGNQFMRLGYSTYAYHNHTYDYYDRDISHPNLGYDYKGYGSGLDVTYTWPESDLEMMELTVSEYVDDPQFHVYYMTVSGHMNYNWGGNAMSARHQEEVADLPYSDANKAYLACNIELDLALENLLAQLEAAGQLENTVIALSADHYPYGLENADIDELAGHTVERNFELYKSTFILWNCNMIEPVTIDKYCSSLDIIPTLSNIFGLEYDSRLLMGRDILSDSSPLVIFSNKSWITDKAMYNSQTAEITPIVEGDTISAEYVQQVNEQVANKFTFSTYILDNDYYRVLFGDTDGDTE